MAEKLGVALTWAVYLLIARLAGGTEGLPFVIGLLAIGLVFTIVVRWLERRK